MMRFILFMITFGLLISCDKVEPDYSETINETIFSIDEYIYTGYFEEPANIKCIPNSEVIGSYNLSITKYDKWEFSYKPPYDYVGTEAFTIISSRLSKEEPDLHIVDSIRIIIEVISDDFRESIIGNWSYVQSCGGYDGGCWDHFEGEYKISFSSDMIYSKLINDTLKESFLYDFIDGFRIHGNAVYRIQFDNGYSTFTWFSNDRLKIEEGDFVNEFEKFEE